MNSRTARRLICRLIYLLPLILFVAFCIYAAIPHVWFVYSGKAQPTMSLFSLQANAWESAEIMRENTDAASINLTNAITVASILFWGALVLLGLFAILVAVCSLVAFSQSPTSTLSNRTKRVLGLLCPNRITYLILPLFSLIPAFMPQILEFAYRTTAGIEMRAHAFPFYDFVMALILIAGSLIPYLTTLSWQGEEHLDMFRIYRAGKPSEKGGTDA